MMSACVHLNSSINLFFSIGYNMKVKLLHLIKGAREAEGLTVIIDVFRAFSVACYAVGNGAAQIIPVGEIQLAYQLKADNPDYILMGERGGKIQPGFDYGNSPSQIAGLDFSGKTVVQTTSSGTQGFANARRAALLVSGSFVNAEAVVSFIRLKAPDQVSLVCMGTRGVAPGPEDTLCGEYIRDRLSGRPIDRRQVVRQLKKAATAQKFLDPSKPWYPRADLELCSDVNRFGFVLVAEAFKEGLLALRPHAVDV